MKQAVRLVILTLALLTVTAPAEAREYIVHSCKLPDGTAAPADGWRANGSAPYMWFDNGCSRGGSLVAGLAGDAQPANSSVVGWGFHSGQAAIRGYRIVRSGVPRGHSGGTSMLVFSADSENSPDTGKHIDYCAAYRGCASIGGLLVRGAPAVPDDSHAWFLSIVCGGIFGEICGLAPGAADFGFVQIDQASFTLEDSEAPTVDRVEGSLADSGAVAGQLRFTVSDATSGVRRAGIEIDNSEVTSAVPDTGEDRCKEVGQSALPDFRYIRPCPDRAQLELELSAGAIPPGMHVMRVRAYDAAGNATTVLAPRTLNVSGVTANAIAQLVPDRSNSLSASYGRRLNLTGVLTSRTGAPIPGAAIDAAIDAPAAAISRRTVRALTDATGRYSIGITATSSRRIELIHAESGARARQRLTVKSPIRLRAERRRVPSLGRMRLAGEIKTERMRKRASVAIKVQSGRSWRTIGIARTDLRGRFTFSYRFRRTRAARFTFRAVALRSSDLAVSPSPSNRARVRVG